MTSVMSSLMAMLERQTEGRKTRHRNAHTDFLFFLFINWFLDNEEIHLRMLTKHSRITDDDKKLWVRVSLL